MLEIINETTAAVIDYQFRNFLKAKKVLVFRSGASSLDASVFELNGEKVEAKSHSGYIDFGGEILDDILMLHCVNRFHEQNKGYDQTLLGNKRALRKLRKECEMIKRQLSDVEETHVYIDGLINDLDFTTTITRKMLDNLAIKYYEETEIPVKKAIREAGLELENIDEVLLVGGSSRIPFVNQRLAALFNKKKLKSNFNAYETAVCGAAIQGATLVLNINMKVQEVSSKSIGTNNNNNEYFKIIKRGSALPACSTVSHDLFLKEKTTISFYEGDRKVADENWVAAKISLESPNITSEFTAFTEIVLDVNGIFTVRNIQLPKNINCIIDQERFTTQQIKDFRERLIKTKEKDKESAERSKAKSHFEELVFQLKARFSHKLEEKFAKVFTWIRETSSVSVDEYNRRQEALQLFEKRFFDLFDEEFPQLV